MVRETFAWLPLQLTPGLRWLPFGEPPVTRLAHPPPTFSRRLQTVFYRLGDGHDMTNSFSNPKDSMERRGSRPVKRGERGNAMMEFGIVVPFILLTLFGSVSLGVMLGRSVLVNQVCRDLAHMYVDGVDFTQVPNQNIAVQLASGIGMTAAGGNGVVL